MNANENNKPYEFRFAGEIVWIKSMPLKDTLRRSRHKLHRESIDTIRIINYGTSGDPIYVISMHIINRSDRVELDYGNCDDMVLEDYDRMVQWWENEDAPDGVEVYMKDREI